MISHTKTVLHPTTYLLDTEAGPNLINKGHSKPQFRFLNARRDSQTLRTATKEAINVQGIIPLIVRMGACRFKFGSQPFEAWQSMSYLEQRISIKAFEEYPQGTQNSTWHFSTSCYSGNRYWSLSDLNIVVWSAYPWAMLTRNDLRYNAHHYSSREGFTSSRRNI